jgi:hypothetical protein
LSSTRLRRTYRPGTGRYEYSGIAKVPSRDREIRLLRCSNKARYAYSGAATEGDTLTQVQQQREIRLLRGSNMFR